jgi:hypothetical protein
MSKTTDPDIPESIFSIHLRRYDPLTHSQQLTMMATTRMEKTSKLWWFVVLSGVFVAITIPFVLVNVVDVVGFPSYQYYDSSSSSLDNFVIQFQRTRQWLLQQQHDVLLFQFLHKIIIENSWWQMEMAWQYYEMWQSSLLTAIRDCATAVSSVCQFSFYTVQPVAYLLYWIVVRCVLIRGLYRFVILRGICSPHAISEMKRFARRVVTWQRSLSPRQILVEMSVITGIVLTIQILKFLKRRKYLRKARIYMNKKRTNLAQVRTYICVCFI